MPRAESVLIEPREGRKCLAVLATAKFPPPAGTTYFIKPLSAIHFWIMPAIWSEFVSISCMLPMPLTPGSGSESHVALPPVSVNALW